MQTKSIHKKHTEGFKQKLVQRALMPGAPPQATVAREAGVSQSLLWRWVADAKLAAVAKTPPPQSPSQRPDDRSPEEKLRIVLAAAALSNEALGEFVRREGVHEADLAAWRETLQEAALAGFGGAAKDKRDAKRIRELEAELRRKDKALAETAALLILKKKALAIWGDGDDDTKPESDE